MSIPTLEDLLAAEVSMTSSFDEDPVPVGDHQGVITGAEIRQGQKGPYINVEVTVHTEGYKGRKVWGICSFSEKALTMPGGPANLLQATKDVIGTIPSGLSSAETMAWVTSNIRAVPVTITVEHEQAVKDGKERFLPDGRPLMKPRVRLYSPADPEFIADIEADAAGIDDDLPF